MADKRYLIVDAETGGFVPEEHPLLEIALRLEASDDDPSAKEFVAVITPTRKQWEACSPGALKVNQFTWEELQDAGDTLDTVSLRLGGWLLDNNVNNHTVVWAGQNSGFDQRFFEHYFRDVLEFVGMLPFPETLDTMVLARKLKDLDKSFRPTSLSGGGIALALGLIPEDSLHRARGGVYACRQNLFELQRRLSLHQHSVLY